MKVLYIYRWGILGGVTTQIRTRARALCGTLEADVFFLRDGGEIEWPKKEANTFLVTDEASLVRRVEEGGYEAITVIDTPEVYPWLRKCRELGPVINEVHTTTYNLKYVGELDRTLPIRALITPSHNLRQRVIDDCGVGDAWPVYVVPNCSDVELFQPRSVQSPERPIILWVGKLDDHKNWRGFIDVAAEIRSGMPEAEFWMVGGRTARPETVDEFFLELDLRGLIADLRWIHSVPYGRMPQVYSLVAQSGGAALSVSRDESFGMSVAEAMACECPVIAPSVGALSELLDGEFESCLHPAGDTEAAAARVLSLLTGEAEREQLAKAGRKRIVERCSPEVVGTRYMEVVEAVVSGRELPQG